jgi:integrase
MDSVPSYSDRYRIARFRVSQSEEMAALVDAGGVPLRMPLRWLVQQRRQAVGSTNTLIADLQGVLELYRWAADAEGAPDHLDTFLAGGGRFEPRELLGLRHWVREQTYERTGVMVTRSMGTISRRIGSIAEFLGWAADVHGWGGKIRVPPAELQGYRMRIDETFAGLKKAGPSTRPKPLTPEQDTFLRELIRPKLGPGGRLAWPIRFPGSNPFTEKIRLRVWLCYLLMRDLGLRKGEVLKLTIQDVERETVKVRRRASDPDPRNPAPKVKGRERALPLTQAIRQAFRAYTSLNHPGRRRRGGYPYLIASRTGTPLSITGFDRVWKYLREHHPAVGRLAPHVLRHTWADAVAADLLARGKSDETALSLLRALGGWAERTQTPHHYVQNAISRQANEMLRQYNDAMYERSDQGE